MICYKIRESNLALELKRIRTFNKHQNEVCDIWALSICDFFQKMSKKVLADPVVVNFFEMHSIQHLTNQMTN